MRLSNNFTLEEFTRTAHKGILNNPTGWHIENLINWCIHIGEPVREHFGLPVIILSGFRSSALNAAVGGAKTSQHLEGQAADFNFPGVRNDVVWEWIINNCDYDQIIAESLVLDNGQAGWLHCSYKPNGRKEALSQVDGKYYPGLRYAE